MRIVITVRDYPERGPGAVKYEIEDEDKAGYLRLWMCGEAWATTGHNGERAAAAIYDELIARLKAHGIT